MFFAKKNLLKVPVWILDTILRHGIAIERALPCGALSTLDALEQMIDELIEIHTNLSQDVHQALISQQPCADLSDAGDAEAVKKREPEGVELPCPDKNQYLN